MVFFYDLAIRLYLISIKVYALFNAKAAKWANGRKSVFQDLEQAITNSRQEGQDLIWIHCASLGEFEQGRPVIEGLKKNTPNTFILLTFFSPSGYEVRKNYAHVDHICYLPIDTASNARRFISITQPNLAIFVKYEFWFHYLTQLDRRKVSSILISALFRPQQVFFKWYGGLFRKMLRSFDHIFVQNESSGKLLEGLTGINYSISGDTRIDRVAQMAEQAPKFPDIEIFQNGDQLFIAGSTWPEDEALLLPFFNQHLPPNWKIILAPHEVAEEKIKKLESVCELPVVRYSQFAEKGSKEKRILIIDNIGMLSALYQYGRIAYIGGGFGAGIHNTLEPITFGLPVIFGPKYQKFEEAVTLIKQGGAFSINDQASFEAVFSRLMEEEYYHKASGAAKSYIHSNKGATIQVLDYISDLPYPSGSR